MKNKEIEDIINFIKKTDLDDVSIETENYKIRVKKNNNQSYFTSKKSTKKIKEVEKKVEDSEIDNKLTIKSPMIGTFYRAANPESDPFIKEGDKVSKGQTICIIEAMKLFNEIESEISGTIVEILVDDASPVEYDQDLFIIDPS